MKRILFIEDESALQKAFSDTLTEEGYEVVSALDGEIGLRLAKEKKPDVILLDLVLPRLHGFDVLSRLKQDEETKHIPVIVMTNLEEMENVQKALELGATTYLVKSNYQLHDVVERVKQLLAEES
ncbi:response regulator [Patescibacteria group bacterium]|nr:response regulator [Patescibacteria group bacterium]